MNFLKPIVEYIEYLDTEKNMTVSLHIHKIPTPVGFHFLEKHTSHINPYCSYIKQGKEARWKCLKCQRKSFEKCKTQGSFSGICHAGVFEFVYPLRIKDEIVGILSVSGYKADNGNEYIEKISKEFSIDKTTLTSVYEGLKTHPTDKKTIDVLIIPLLSMIELFFSKQGLDMKAKKPLSDNILEYCRNNYNRKITAEMICKKYFCSRSYIAHSFKRKTGKSLPEYVNSLRIESAKNMLESSGISIAEIASAVGFEDRSYFSKCFTKETGMSPKLWRQKYGKSKGGHQ